MAFFSTDDLARAQQQRARDQELFCRQAQQQQSAYGWGGGGGGGHGAIGGLAGAFGQGLQGNVGNHARIRPSDFMDGYSRKPKPEGIREELQVEIDDWLKDAY